MEAESKEDGDTAEASRKVTVTVDTRYCTVMELLSGPFRPRAGSRKSMHDNATKKHNPEKLWLQK